MRAHKGSAHALHHLAPQSVGQGVCEFGIPERKRRKRAAHGPGATQCGAALTSAPHLYGMCFCFAASAIMTSCKALKLLLMLSASALLTPSAPLLDMSSEPARSTMYLQTRRKAATGHDALQRSHILLLFVAPVNLFLLRTLMEMMRCERLECAFMLVAPDESRGRETGTSHTDYIACNKGDTPTLLARQPASTRDRPCAAVERSKTERLVTRTPPWLSC